MDSYALAIIYTTIWLTGNATRFLELLKAEYEKYFGLTGSSAFAQKLFKSMTECFDWRFFLEQQNQVQKSHLQSFQKVVDSLQTCLEKAGWPDPVQFPWLERTWRPKCKERDQAEYFCLIKRLKKEYGKSLADGNFNVFNDLVAYEVTPVSLSNCFLLWVDQLMAQSHILRSQPVAAAQSFSVVSAFLVGEKSFLLQPDSLKKNWTFWISAGTSFATWAIQRWSGKFWLGSCQCISWFAVGKAGPGQEQDLAGESGQSSPVSRLQQGTFASTKGGYHQEKCARTLLARSFRASLCEMLLRARCCLGKMVFNYPPCV